MQTHIKALTGVRAIAAYMVFLHHFNVLRNFSYMQWLSQIVDEFHIGVTIFFVLSGFLIYYRYYGQVKNKKFSWGIYIKNRVARIYPMYFILTTITFVAIVWYHQYPMFSTKETVVLYGLNLTFLRGFFDSFKFSGIIQGWSLTVEECFYFLAPLLFFFFTIRKWVFPLLAIYVSGILLTLFFRQFNFYGFFGNFNFLFGFTFFGRAFEFFCGMGLAYYLGRRKNDTVKAIRFTLIGAVFILLSAYALALVKIHYNVQQGPYHPIGRVINNLLLPLFIVLFFRGLIHENNIITRVLSSRLLVILGKSSYVFYLIHMGIFYDLVVYLFPGQTFLLPFLLLNLISVLLFQFVEEPLNKRIRRIILRKNLNE